MQNDRKPIADGHPWYEYTGRKAQYRVGETVFLTDDAAENYNVDPETPFTVEAVTIGKDEKAGPETLMYDVYGNGFSGAVYAYEVQP